MRILLTTHSRLAQSPKPPKTPPRKKPRTWRAPTSMKAAKWALLPFGHTLAEPLPTGQTSGRVRRAPPIEESPAARVSTESAIPGQHFGNEFRRRVDYADYTI